MTHSGPGLMATTGNVLKETFYLEDPPSGKGSRLIHVGDGENWLPHADL